MPLGDLASGLFGFIGRMLGHLVIDLLLEIAIKGPGYLLARSMRRRGSGPVDPDGWLVGLLGIGFWIIVGGAAYLIVSRV